ncbi:MAG TPA: serine hydrolase domain-containing protein [Acidimicrobiia bacterium]|nr:serine hydrolase domain-containing protein [Acidimicrobiia bacterium]
MFDGLVDELEALVATGVMPGAQAVVRHHGEVVLDIALGECAPGQPMLSNTPHDVYCALKPITGCAMLAALEQAGVTLDTSLAGLVGAPGDATLRDVLEHNVGLAAPLALEAHWQHPSDRTKALKPDQLVGQLRRGTGVYSEVAAWTLLGAATRAIVGREPIDVITSAIADLGLINTFVATSWSGELADRIGCYFDMAGAPPLPLLHDRLPRFLDSDFTYAIGGYTTMADLAAFYEHVLATLDGVATPGLPTPSLLNVMLAGERSPRADAVLGRDCRFSGGFMVDLSTHFFGRQPGSNAFGHAGFLGNSFGFADPERELAAAVLLNGIRTGDTAAEIRRPWLVNCLYDDVSVLA